MKRLLLLVGVVVVVVAGLLVSQVINGKRNDPEALRDRVSQYWEAVRINDHLTRYRLMTGYAEGRLQPDQLPAQMSPELHVLSFKVGQISMEGDGTAEVEVDLQLTLPKFEGKGFQRKSREHWAYIGDNWYRGLRADDLAAIKKIEESSSSE